LHYPDISQPPRKYLFRTALSVVCLSDRRCLFLTIRKAQQENRLLSDIQKNVEAIFVNGRPRHHQESAHITECNLQDPLLSSIFVVDWKDFIQMTRTALLNIFKDRHILVLNALTSGVDFSLKALSALGALDKVRIMQGMHYLALCS